tara:strand:- start:109 stop:378 length:270 start_codon:yes stop_codon:yes gene_type:complete
MNKYYYFTASWCGPCKVFGPQLEKIKGEVNFIKIDVDNDPQNLKNQFNIRSVPSLVLVDPRGSELTRLVGVTQHTNPIQEVINTFNRYA